MKDFISHVHNLLIHVPLPQVIALVAHIAKDLADGKITFDEALQLAKDLAAIAQAAKGSQPAQKAA